MVQICELSSRGRGKASGREGGSSSPLAGFWRSQRGAVISLDLGGGEKDHLGHFAAVAMVTRLNGRGHLSTLTFRWGEHSGFPNLKLINETSYLIGISELELSKGDEEETRKPIEIFKDLALGRL